MPSRRTVLAATAGGLVATATPALATETNLKSLVDIQLAKLREQYDTVAIGAFRGRERYAVNGDAIFQIGSITKTFTGLALAIADRSGRMSLDDELASYIALAPKKITLAHCASHTSGLERIPPGLLEDPDFDPLDPYAHLTEAKLAEALRKTKPLTEPGSTYLYSNYAAGLLGKALNNDYEAMIRRQILWPLGLRDTAITLTNAQRRRKVQGYDANGASTPDWRLPVIAGAGALYGTVNDLFRYMRAYLGEAPRHLKPALDLAQRPRFTVNEQVQVALGWHTFALSGGRTAIWHDGGTGGFSSITGFSKDRYTGVTILVNKYGAALAPSAIEILEAL